MDFGINVDFAVRRGSTHEESFQEAFELVDLAEAITTQNYRRRLRKNLKQVSKAMRVFRL